MRHYGLPHKIVSLIKLFFERFECGVILMEVVLDFFEIQIRMRGMYAFTTAFPHPHRLRNENSQRKITQRYTVGDFFRLSGIPR